MSERITVVEKPVRVTVRYPSSSSVASALNDHLADPVDAHDASAVSYANAELVGVDNVASALDSMLGGGGLTDNFVTLATAQSITGAKSFTKDITMTDLGALTPRLMVGAQTFAHGGFSVARYGISFPGDANAGRTWISGYGGIKFFTGLNTSLTDREVLTVLGGDVVTANGAEGNVGINTLVPAAMLQITARAATSVGMILRGAASQTADLLRLTDSADTNLTVVSSGGSLSTRGLRVETPPALPGAGPGMFMGRTGGGGLNTYLFSSQNKFTTEVYDSAGVYKGDGFVHQLNTPGFEVYMPLLVHGTLGATTATTLAVRAIAAQTGDLQQWRDSGAGVVARIKSSGQLNVNSTGVLFNAYGVDNGAGTEGRLSLNTSLFFDMNKGLQVPSIISYALGSSYRFEPGNPTNIYTNNILRLSLSSTGTATFTPDAGAVGAMLKGAAAQTGHLLSFADSANVVQSYIDSGGRALFKNWFVGTTAPVSPAVGDVWVDTT